MAILDYNSKFKHSKTVTLAGAGTQTAGLAFGGYTGTAPTAATEQYDGTSWTSSNNLNTARNGLGGAGTQTAALGFGGNPGPTGATEEYDGISWTTSPASLNTARYYLGGAGTQASALAFGGLTPTFKLQQQKNGQVQHQQQLQSQLLNIYFIILIV
jgi:hypothetical protein